MDFNENKRFMIGLAFVCTALVLGTLLGNLAFNVHTNRLIKEIERQHQHNR